jgi:hypothetical protein
LIDPFFPSYGYLGATLEWDETDRCGDDAGVGQEHDLERSAPNGGAESPGLPKGIRLSKKAMAAVEARLERDPKLPKYDILIQPASTA